MIYFLFRTAVRGPLMVVTASITLYVWQVAAQIVWLINYRACTSIVCIVEPRDPLDTFAFLREMPYELFTYYWQGPYCSP